MTKPRAKFLDRDHPFFAARWVRWVTFLFPCIWGIFELYGGNPGWAILFIAAGAYAGYELIFAAKKP